MRGTWERKNARAVCHAPLLGPQEEWPRMPLGAGTQATAGTGRAGLVVDAHPDDRVVVSRAGRGRLGTRTDTTGADRLGIGTPRPLDCGRATA